MSTIKPRLIVNQILSPYGISIVSTIIFLLAWIFPPRLYTDLISEPDLMYLDPETLLFFILCVTGFCFGVYLVDFIAPGRSLLESPILRSELKGLALLAPLFFTTCATGMAAVQIFRQTPDLLSLLVSQQGDAIKDQMGDGLGVFGWGANLQIPVLWWTFWHLAKVTAVRGIRSRLGRVVSWTFLAVALLVQAAFCVARVSRGDLMPVLAGLAVLFVLRKIKRKEWGGGRVLVGAFLSPLAVAGLFSLFAVLRGTTDLTGGLQQLVGYTFASYNRLTAVLRGTMHYPYSGHGVYAVMFLTSSSVVNAVIPVREIFGWPTFYDLWKSEFEAPQLAGLNPFLIWAGTFGYLFSDFGWLTPLILLFQGTLYSLVWKQIKAETTFGIILYPWFAYCALCWFATNTVFDFRLPFFLAAAVLLTGYERVALMLRGKPFLQFGQLSEMS